MISFQFSLYLKKSQVNTFHVAIFSFSYFSNFNNIAIVCIICNALFAFKAL